MNRIKAYGGEFVYDRIDRDNRILGFVPHKEVEETSFLDVRKLCLYDPEEIKHTVKEMESKYTLDEMYRLTAER